MPQLKLSKRLSAIAELIPAQGGVADIGTDHGYIPAWLRQTGFSSFILATDINELPLGHAIETAVEYGVADSISFLLCDGLQGVCSKHLKSIIIAGMGGETIAEILSHAPWTKEDGRTLILQPMTKSDFLRQWLYENGYTVLFEDLVEDDRIYELLTAAGGLDVPYSPGQLHTGHLELIENNALFAKKLDGLITKTQNALAGLSVSTKSGDNKRLAEYKTLLDDYKTMHASL